MRLSGSTTQSKKSTSVKIPHSGQHCQRQSTILIRSPRVVTKMRCVSFVWVSLSYYLICTNMLTCSTDGGGVRGLASLHLLKAVIERFNPDVQPCEVFDMIGGTSTGG